MGLEAVSEVAVRLIVVVPVNASELSEVQR